jgi:cytochrome c553
MAQRPIKTPSKSDEAPAGAPPGQRSIDRPWRIWASVIVVLALFTAGLLGLVIIPAGQRENAHLSMGEAVHRAAGLSPGSPAVPQPFARATAIPVSQVSWDPEIMRILRSGNTKRGADLATRTCAACHGDKGLSQGPIPSLAGQSPYAIFKQLHDFRSGARVNQQMTPVARRLPPEDLAAVAAYYAAASKEYTALGLRFSTSDEVIVRLANEGDSRRRIPACVSCHMNGSGGPIETPVIVGQTSEYILAQLNAYANGTRKNDVYGRMRDISHKLTPEERAALARYFEGTL